MKKFALGFLLALTLLSVIMALPACAGSKPSVPEFTVKVNDYSYDVPTTYSLDKYTGETITHPGYHVGNQTIIVTIKNQPFASSVANLTYYLCYNVRFKGHFEEEGWGSPYYFSGTSIGYPLQSASGYTEISFQKEYPANAQVDVQTQAVLVRDAQVRVYDHLMDFVGHLTSGYAIDDTSDWSSTQTITISGSTITATPSASPSPNLTATPDHAGSQGFDWIEIGFFSALGVIVALLVVIVFMQWKLKKTLLSKG